MAMNEETAIKLATNALTNRSSVDAAYWKVYSDRRDGRKVIVVVFRAKEQADVIVSPDTFFAEVDEETGEVVFARGP